ncbi:sugar ABC transporter permease [Chelativorans sp.]|uniref:carbohydrate ABC transporter permease n=1 Tax=Chelativorans sp. TaxID=2203393 RepID=UPI002811A9A5|nr:sugar ABC transporter permease [Chelativorans sp.]
MIRSGMRLPIALSLAPGVALFATFFVVPFALLVTSSFSEWSGLEFRFTGLENFQRMLADFVFWRAAGNTVFYSAVGVFVQVPLGCLIGIILAQKIRGWKVFRAIIFVPWVISGAAFALVFSMFYNPRFGLLNDILALFGFASRHDWLFDTSTARFAIAGTFAFVLGFTMIVVMAEIASIPKELYEAAECDGAQGWRLHRYITLPLLRNAIGTCVLIRLLSDIGLFDIVYILTLGGPNDSTVTLALYGYRAYLSGEWGFASAIGSTILLIGLVLILSVSRLFRLGERAQ